jgi:hypothetical protein
MNIPEKKRTGNSARERKARRMREQALGFDLSESRGYSPITVKAPRKVWRRKTPVTSERVASSWERFAIKMRRLIKPARHAMECGDVLTNIVSFCCPPMGGNPDCIECLSFMTQRSLMILDSLRDQKGYLGTCNWYNVADDYGSPGRLRVIDRELVFIQHSFNFPRAPNYGTQNYWFRYPDGNDGLIEREISYADLSVASWRWIDGLYDGYKLAWPTSIQGINPLASDDAYLEYSVRCAYYRDFHRFKRLIFNLKLILGAYILSGRIPVVEASSGSSRLVSSVWSTFSNAFEILFGLVSMLLSFVFGLGTQLITYLNQFDAMIARAPDIAFDIAGLLVVLLFCYSIHRLVGMREVKVSDKLTRDDLVVVGFSTISGVNYVKLRDGHGVFDVKYNPNEVSLPQLEMAMPGSSLAKSKKRPGVAALMVEMDGALALAGTCFRFHDHLVTAGHVANMISAGINRVALVPLIQDPSTKVCKIDTKASRLVYFEPNVFDQDNNLCPLKDLDAFVLKVDKSVWSKTGIENLVYKTGSYYNQQVSTCAFHNGLLVTSTGKISKGDSLFVVNHNATTHKGFSGSPVFCGSAVVAMHISGCADANQAIRIEPIANIIGRLPSVESKGDAYDEFGVLIKYHGRSGRIHETDWGDAWFEAHDGTIYELEGEVRERFERARAYVEEFESDIEDGYDSGDDNYVPKNLRKLDRLIPDYDDENAELPYEKFRTNKRIHLSSYPEASKVVSELLTFSRAEAVKLGFEDETYGPFENTYSNEKVSIEKHITLFLDRRNSCVEPPSVGEMERCIEIMVEQCSANRWTPVENYDSRDTVLAILDTSSFKLGKSAGIPYVHDKLPLNKDVLEHYGADGLADIVMREWDEPIKFRMFNKLEAHKRKKLDAGMLRLIFSAPNHWFLKNVCLFMPLLLTACKAWKKSPICYCYNPLVPGDSVHVWKRLAGKQVCESDKTNWDFNWLEWIINVVTEVVIRLIDYPTSWNLDRCKLFEQRVRDTIAQAFHNCIYVASDGTEYHTKFDGVMKSGWFLTILFNTFGVYAVHIMTCVRMRLSREQIASDDMQVVAGGDDLLQNFPDGFDVREYFASMNLLGVAVKDYRVLNGMENAEFYSSTFHLVDGVVHTKPVRFTKHIYNLTLVKDVNLAQALLSHMTNYCFDSKKFYFFKKLFDRLRETRPDLIGDAKFVTRAAICNRVLGVELLDSESTLPFTWLDDPDC